jgi:hypothetical protein
MLRIVLIIALFLINVPLIVAQSITFLPEGKFYFNYQLSRSSADRVFTSKQSKETILERKLSDEGLDEKAVSGNIKYESTSHLFQLQWGLGSSINFAFFVPYLSQERNSSLRDKTGDNQSFLDKYQDASSTGFGDYEFYLIKRFNYTDEHDFQMGVGYNYNNGAFNYNKNDALPLGSGTSEFFYFLNWTIFALESNLKTDIHYKEIYTIFGSITDETGKSKSLKRKNSRVASVHAALYPDEFHYGAGIEFVNQTNTNIGGNELHDGYFQYAYDMFFGWGNLVKLETELIELPLEGELYYKSVFYGLNANKTSTFGVRATLYF